MEFLNVHFKCPQCGHDVVSLMRRMEEFIDVTHCDPDTLNLEYGDTLDMIEQKVYDYACHSCGFRIGANEKEAAKWLKEKGMVR